MLLPLGTPPWDARPSIHLDPWAHQVSFFLARSTSSRRACLHCLAWTDRLLFDFFPPPPFLLVMWRGFSSPSGYSCESPVWRLLLLLFAFWFSDFVPLPLFFSRGGGGLCFSSIAFHLWCASASLLLVPFCGYLLGCPLALYRLSPPPLGGICFCYLSF